MQEGPGHGGQRRGGLLGGQRWRGLLGQQLRGKRRRGLLGGLLRGRLKGWEEPPENRLRDVKRPQERRGGHRPRARRHKLRRGRRVRAGG